MDAQGGDGQLTSPVIVFFTGLLLRAVAGMAQILVSIATEDNTQKYVFSMIRSLSRLLMFSRKPSTPVEPPRRSKMRNGIRGWREDVLLAILDLVNQVRMGHGQVERIVRE